MTLRAEYRKFTLRFNQPLRTSRDVINKRTTYILLLWDNDSRVGIGECAPLPGLSFDDKPDYQQVLHDLCTSVSGGDMPDLRFLRAWPSIRFGLESAMLGLKRFPGPLFDTDFTRGTTPMTIHGLIVMSSVDEMYTQVHEKVAAGFRCIKMKVGAHPFEEELRLLKEIRRQFPASQIELRLDANGAFSELDALEKLKGLAQFDIHSIEQPLPHGNRQATAELAAKSPVPIALDEELIGVHDIAEKRQLLALIRPALLILKPTLLGGMAACQEWITLCESMGIEFRINSILESNVGLSVIAQWTSTLQSDMIHGLGSGRLFARNFKTPVHLRQAHLCYQQNPRPVATHLRNLELA